MANKKITDLMSGTPVRDSLLESATDVGGTMVSRKFKVGAVADVNNVQIANEYDDTATYTYGAYCIKDGVLYRCTTAISVAEAWDSTHWTAVMVTGEFRRVVELTSAQYTALSSAEKNNGTLYIITDEETTADDIPYSQGVSVADMLDITDITSSYCTLSTGYSLDAGSRVYKQGRHIWGNLLVIASTALPGANDSVNIGLINSAYRTESAINGFCGLSNGQWFTNEIGYLYIAVNGSMAVASPSTGKTYIKMMIDYCTA